MPRVLTFGFHSYTRNSSAITLFVRSDHLNLDKQNLSILFLNHFGATLCDGLSRLLAISKGRPVLARF